MGQQGVTAALVPLPFRDHEVAAHAQGVQEGIGSEAVLSNRSFSDAEPKIYAASDFPNKNSTKNPSQNSSRWKAVIPEVSNNEGADIFGAPSKSRLAPMHCDVFNLP